MTCVEIIDGLDRRFARWNASDDSNDAWFRIVEYRNETRRGSRVASDRASRRRDVQTGSGSSSSSRDGDDEDDEDVAAKSRG